MPDRRHAVLVNLADLGRSPRAQFHCASLLEAEWRVTALASDDSPLEPRLLQSDSFRLRDLPALREPFPAGIRGALGKSAAWKQDLETALGSLEDRVDALLVMTPPALPTFPCLRRWMQHHPESRILMDWHNLGHTQMALRRGATHPLTRIYRWRETRPWPSRVAHLTVSRALARHLENTLGTSPVHPLHDRAPGWRRHEVRDRVQFLNQHPVPHLRADTRWVVYPHSWSVDEHADWILQVAQDPELETLQILVTGEGPEKTAFQGQLSARGIPPERVLTPFLSPQGYAALLHHADWGLCLHRSSSKLDLPMKLADMKGAGLPALTFRYGEVLEETFSPPQDGELFDSVSQLQELLRRIACNALPTRNPDTADRWEDEWNRVVPPLLNS